MSVIRTRINENKWSSKSNTELDVQMLVSRKEYRIHLYDRRISELYKGAANLASYPDVIKPSMCLENKDVTPKNHLIFMKDDI